MSRIKIRHNFISTESIRKIETSGKKSISMESISRIKYKTISWVYKKNKYMRNTSISIKSKSRIKNI